MIETLGAEIIINGSKVSIYPTLESLFPRKQKDIEAIAEDMGKNGYNAAFPLLLADIEPEDKMYLLDGHTRVLAAEKAGVELNNNHIHIMDFPDMEAAIDYAIHIQKDRRNLTDADIASCISVLDQLKTAGRPLKELAGPQANLSKGKSSQETAEKLGIGRDKVERTRAVLKNGTPEIREAVISGEKSINQAYNEIKKIKQNSILAVPSSIPDLNLLADSGKKFGCIYADPPWQYGNQGTRAATNNHYPTMSIEDIAQLPVGKLATEKSHLHLWTTNGFLRNALNLIEEWGFEYKGMLVWVKPQMGLGNYWRVSHEYLLLGVKGNLTFMDRGQMSWLQADRTGHSSKPEQVREILQKVSPPPYLELFARQTCEGWTSWANQVEDPEFQYRETA